MSSVLILVIFAQLQALTPAISRVVGFSFVATERLVIGPDTIGLAFRFVVAAFKLKAGPLRRGFFIVRVVRAIAGGFVAADVHIF